jgi:NodT family efflux transporter outer membrane factor (OMF) lipoprotein
MFATNAFRPWRLALHVVGLAGLLTTACMVGPDYKRPSAPVPPAFKEPTPAAVTGASEWVPARPADTGPRGRWWEVFGDAELNTLEEQVSVSNQTIAQADAQYRSARAVARGARADLFPTLSVAPSASRSKAAATSFAPHLVAPTINTYQLAGDVTYEVDVWGRIRRNLESTVGAAQASAADLETIRLSLHADLAADYFALRGVDNERRLLASSVEEYEKALLLTTRRHDEGVVSGVDVAQAQTILESTRAQLTELGITRAQLEHAIAILVGKPPSDLSIAQVETSPVPPTVPEELPSQLLERRPDIAGAERLVAAANAQIGVAQAAFFPNLLLNATGGWSTGSLSRFFSAPNLFWSLGAALAQTIFEGGKRIAAKDQAIANYDAAVAAYRQSVLASFEDVEDNLASLRLLAEEAQQQARAAEAAERAVTLSRNRYEGGITIYLEVVTAQTAALANERAVVQLETRRMTSSVGLIKALGGGWSATQLPTPAEVLSSSASAAPAGATAASAP